MIEVRSASGAETEACFLTERLHGKRQLNLFRGQMAQRNFPLGVVLDIEIFFRDLDFLVCLEGAGGRARAESYGKRRKRGNGIRIETAGTAQVRGVFDRPAGHVLPRVIPLGNLGLDADRTDAIELDAVEIGRLEVERRRLLLRPSLVDIIKTNHGIHGDKRGERRGYLNYFETFTIKVSSPFSTIRAISTLEAAST